MFFFSHKVIWLVEIDVLPNLYFQLKLIFRYIRGGQHLKKYIIVCSVVKLMTQLIKTSAFGHKN